jgi:photosystem II stability/assembly factor-like uncharacterized protein
MGAARSWKWIALLAIAIPSSIRAETLTCRTLRGPCEFLDSLDVFVAGPAPILVANFGLVARNPNGRLEYSCESALGGLAPQVRMSPDGEIFVAGDSGVTIYRRGCGGARASGDVVGRPMREVAFDPRDRRRLWALGAEGPTVYLSSDGGASFARTFVFPPAQDVLQLRVAAARPDMLYGAGEATNGRLLLVRSDDGGRTFAEVSGARPDGLPLALLGIDPQNAEVVFVAARGQDADAIWRSSDGGRSWTRILSLLGSEILAGFTFGAERELFVAGRAQLYEPNAPPARLYRSPDGGDRWDPPIASSASGPRFRCLAFAGDRLYACAGGTPSGDGFLLGSSRDGKAWSPLMTMEELAGPEPCMRESCATTSAWLCDAYRLCGSDRPDAAADAGSPAASGGCGCALGGRPSAAPLLLLALLLGARMRRA